MKKNSLKIGLVLILSTLMMLSACTAQPAAKDSAPAKEAINTAAESTTGKNDSKELYIAIVSKGYQHQYWKAFEQGAKDVADDLGITITHEAPDSQTDYATQADQIATALGKSPDALIIAPLDNEVVLPYLEQAQEQSIPVVIFDAPMDNTDIPVCTVATDNVAASSQAAEELAALLEGKGEIAIISNAKTDNNAILRSKGFKAVIEEKYPDISIVAEDYSDGGDSLKAADAAKAIMVAHPNLKAFYSTAEGNSNGIIAAINETNAAGKYIVVGYDAGKLQKDAVRSGMFAGAIAQDPYKMGRLSMEAAYKAISGETIEKSIDSGFFFYTKDNMDNPEYQTALYD